MGDAVLRKVEDALVREVGEKVGNVVNDNHWQVYIGLSGEIGRRLD